LPNLLNFLTSFGSEWWYYKRRVLDFIGSNFADLASSTFAFCAICGSSSTAEKTILDTRWHFHLVQLVVLQIVLVLVCTEAIRQCSMFDLSKNGKNLGAIAILAVSIITGDEFVCIINATPQE